MTNPCEEQAAPIIIPPDEPTFDCDCESIQAAIEGKQDKLTAGANITITASGVISASGGGGGGTEYQAGENIDITRNVISAPDVYSKDEVDEALQGYATTSEVTAALADYYTMADTAELLAEKQDTLTAGSNITITDNVISATMPDVSNLATKTELAALDASKQDKLTAGSHITISENGTISAECCSKAELLSILGYTDQTLHMTGADGRVTTMHVLGYMEESGAIIDSNGAIVYDGDNEYGQFAVYPVDEPEETTRVKLTVTNAAINGVDVGTLEIESYYSPGGVLFECLPIDEDFGCVYISFWGENAGVYAPDGHIFAFIGQDGDGPQIESFTADSLKVEEV